MKAKTRIRASNLLMASACAAALTAAGLRTDAADRTWSGAGDDNDFTTAANWVGNIAPAPNDSLIFDGFARLSPSNDFASGTAFDGITFASTAGPFNLIGNQITLHGNIADNTPVLPQIISLPLALDATRDIGVTGGGLLTIGGALSGAPGAGITKTGDGLLTLAGANTFTGPININGGVLSVSTPANLGASGATGVLRINGGALRATQNLTLPANRPIVLGPAVGTGAGTFDVTTVTNSGTGGEGSTIVPITLTYGGVISDNGTPGAGTLIKSRFGTLVLSGANTYTGATRVRNGTLTLNFADAAPTTPVNNIISAGSALVLGGATAGLGQNNNATLNMVGKDGANNTQTFAGTHIDIYGSVINVANGAGGTARLNLGALTHTPGGTVVIPTTAGSAGSVYTSTTVGTTNGILGGWAVAGPASTPGPGSLGRGITIGTDWATVDGSGKIVPYTGYVAAPVYTPGDTTTLIRNNPAIAADADKNLKRTGEATSRIMRVDLENAGTTTDINTIAFTTAGANDTLIIGTGNTLRLGRHGGIFKQVLGNNQLYIGGSLDQALTGNGLYNNTPQSTNPIQVGFLTAGGPTTGTPGEIVLTTNEASNNNGTLNILANIVDNGPGGAVTLVKTSVSSVKIDGHNTYSGGTYINQGRFQLAGSEVERKVNPAGGGDLTFGNPDGLGTGPVFVAPGGYLFVSGVNGSGLYTGRGAITGARANTAQNAPILNDITISGNGTSQEGIGAIRLGGKALLSGKITLGGDARIGGSSNNGNPNAAYDAYPGINPDGTTLYIDPGHELSGQITGPFSFDIGSAVSISTNFKISNPANDWSGDTNFITGGGVTILRLGNNEVLPHGPGKGNLVWGSGVTANAATLDLNGFNETINGLSTTTANPASAIIENTGFTATLVGEPGARTYQFTAGPATLTVGGFDQTATFGGTIRDTNTTRTVTVPNPNGTGTQTLTAPWAAAGAKVALTKIGSGVQTLSGNNTYSGDTNVNGGTLAITGTLPNSHVKVNAGGTLSGTGDGSTTGVIGTATVGPSSGTSLARIAPGITSAAGQVGTLTIGNLTSNGGDLKVDLITGNSDRINVTGTASFGGATTISPNAGAKAGDYTILTAANLSIDPTATLTVNDPNDPTARPAAFNVVTDATSIQLKVTGGSKNITWTGAANGNWDINNTTNWRETAAPNAAEKYFNGDIVTFPDAAANKTITLNATVSPGDIIFNNSAGNDYTITGTGSIGGGGSLTKSGEGTLRLLTNANYSGPTTISGGRIEVGNGGTSGSLGTGQINNNGTIIFNRSDALTVSAPISGTGNIGKLGAGTLTLSGVNTFTGSMLVADGTVVAGATGALGGGTADFNAGTTLDINGQNLGTVAIITRGAGVGGNGAIVNTGADQVNALNNVTLAADTVVGGSGRFDIRGSGAVLNTGGQPHKLTKIGTNQFTLTDVNVDDALGDVDVNAGLLRIEGGTDGLGNPARTLRLASGTVLEFVSAGTLNKNITSEGATLRAAAGTGNTISGPVALNASSTLDAGEDDVLNINGLISGPGGVTKVGNALGAVNLNHTANTYQGPTQINSGTLGITSIANGGAPSSIGQSSSAPANLVLNGGTLRFTGNAASVTDRQMTFGGSVGLNASGNGPASIQFTNPAPLTLAGTGAMTLTLSGENTADNTLAAALGDRTGGATSVVKDGGGMWILGGANTYSGPTTLNAGTLRVSGSIANSNSLTAVGGSRLETQGPQTIQNVNLQDATVVVRPAGLNSGVLKAQASGTNTQGLVFTPGSLIDLGTGGIIADYTAGNSNLDAVRSAILSGYSGGSWNGFGIFSTAAQGGVGAVGYGEAGAVLPGGGNFMGLPTDDTAVLLRYTLKGDANLDGTVSFPDLVALAQNYNNTSGTATWNIGDFDYDGNVGFPDLVALAQNYNSSLPTPGSFPASFQEDVARAFAQVPEPSTVLVLGLGAAGLGMRRRRRR